MDRARMLTSPTFIAVLAVFVLNDFVLKAFFHNWWTGKLSDFTGVFVFPIVFTAWAPRYKAGIYAFSGCRICVLEICIRSMADQHDQWRPSNPYWSNCRHDRPHCAPSTTSILVLRFCKGCSRKTARAIEVDFGCRRLCILHFCVCGDYDSAA